MWEKIDKRSTNWYDIFVTKTSHMVDEKRKEKVLDSYKYIKKQWKGIEIYETDGEYLKGCSAEGHISHVYADRMSSRPRTWCDDEIDKWKFQQVQDYQ